MGGHHVFHLWTWLGHFTGVSDEAGPGYGFFSGIGSDIGEITLVGAVYMVWKRHNCGVKGCWRVGRHPVADGTHVACRRHHPDDIPQNVTPGYLAGLHAEHKERTGG